MVDMSKPQLQVRFESVIKKIISDLASLQVHNCEVCLSESTGRGTFVKLVDRYPDVFIEVIWNDGRPYVLQRDKLVECRVGGHVRFPFSGKEHNVGVVKSKNLKPPYHEAFDDPELGLKPNRLDLLMKNGVRILVKQIINKCIAKLLDVTLYPRISSKKAIVQEELALLPGITFRVDSIEDRTIRLSCIDAGGIYDPNPGFENIEHPAQVTEDLYGSSYAALLFLCASSYGFERDRFYRAGVSALNFALRNYDNYPGGRLFFRHHDFKNACIYECMKLLAPNDRFLVKKFLPSAHSYDPTNVHALRIHWLLEKQRTEGSLTLLDKISYWFSKQSVLSSTTPDGFIRDNFRATDVSCNGLSYHQFSLACLARAYAVSGKLWIKDVFTQASRFTQAMQLQNGEVGYSGRGANSIYHLCSAIYGMALDFRINGSDRALISLSRSLSYLEDHVIPGRICPTCLNAYGSTRMGWNATSIPYNAQSAYFLHHALIAIKESDPGPFKSQPEKAWASQIHDFRHSGFSRIGNADLAIVLSDSGASRPWSGYHHHTGAGGLASMSVGGIETLLHLDYLVKQKSYISDIPIFSLHDRAVIPSRVWIFDCCENSISIRVKYKEGLVLGRRYFLKDRCLTIETDIVKASRNVVGGVLEADFKLPVRSNLTLSSDRNVLTAHQDSRKLFRISSSWLSTNSERWNISTIDSNTWGTGYMCKTHPVIITGSREFHSVVKISVQQPRHDF